MADTPKRRETKALEQGIITDPFEIARAEARNGLLQAYEGEQAALAAIERGNFKFRPSLISSLHRTALQGLSSYAGLYRPAAVEIDHSRHQPPESFLVPELIEDLCDFVNTKWDGESPLYLAAYTMWRLNWIHPFTDGNGRTSRIVSYVILSIRAGYVPCGSPSIPAQIEADRGPYFQALEAADEAWKLGELNLKPMQDLLETLLARQLVAFFQSVGGKMPLD
ncbi:MAG: Fic family protein [Beijerinckiaceae bacterium]|nr:Fic family protein [Beijerinckiaceae bacterium]